MLPWFLKSEEHWTKCLDGNYDNKNGKGGNGKSTPDDGWHIPGGSA